MNTMPSTGRGGRELPDYPGFEHRPWVSLHCPVDASLYEAEFDVFLRTDVFPIIRRARAEGQASQAFFVRYGEGGPHVRLRLLPTDDQASRALIELVTKGGTVRGGSPRWRQVPYVPELDRYGGREAIFIAERIFDASTSLAMEDLNPDVSADKALRLGRGLIAMVSTAFAVYQRPNEVAAFMEHYSRNFLHSMTPEEHRGAVRQAFDTAQLRQAEDLAPVLSGLFEQLVQSEPITPQIDRYLAIMKVASSELEQLCVQSRLRTSVKVFHDWNECSRTLCASYVHMMSNRLGINIPDEAFLAFATARSTAAR
jgi:thiopeptide-type bacteriocin biosynthesis protein